MDDDALMDRFDRNARRFGARDALIVCFVALAGLVLLSGSGMIDAGQRLPEGVQRDVVVALGAPVEWVADRTPLDEVAADWTAALSPDEELEQGSGFLTAAATPTAVPGGRSAAIEPVPESAFDPATLGAPPPPKRPLKKLLVTGDSLSTPLDLELARRLSEQGVEVVRDPRLGTGISKTDLLDWGQLSATQVKQEDPDAVVVFIGANEGHPMPGRDGATVDCCDTDWAAIYATRARQMQSTYRGGGERRVYWVTVPATRGAERSKIARVVNAAIEVAAQPFRDAVQLVDTGRIFTPGGVYRDSMPIDGKTTLVRESDGIHLNERGSSLLADVVLRELAGDFGF